MELQFILMFLKNNWKAIVVGVVVIGGLLYVEGLRVENARQATEIVQMEANNKTLQNNNTSLKNAIALSHQALQKSINAGEAAQGDFLALSKEVQIQNNNLSKRLNTVLKDPIPTTCKDTIIYLINAVKEYK